MNFIVKLRVVAVIALLVPVIVPSVAFARTSDTSTLRLAIAIDTVKYGKKGDIHELKTVDVAQNMRGLSCRVEAKAKNQGSVHPNSDLLVRSGNSQISLLDVERAPGVNTTAEETITLSDKLTVSVRLGKDGVFSGGLTVTAACQPAAEKCPVLGKNHLLKADPACKEDEKCPIRGKEQLKKDDASCKEEPQVLPAAGVTVSLLGLPLLATLLGYAASVVIHKRPV